LHFPQFTADCLLRTADFLVKSSLRRFPVRAFLLFLARKEGFKNFALKFKIFRDTAARFVAGETLDDAVRAVRQAKLQSATATLDLLGEDTRSQEDAQGACRDIIGTLDRIRSEKLDCNVSVKLTQLGLGIDPESAYGNLLQIVEHARAKGNFIRVDMEDGKYTQRTLDMVTRTHEQFDNIGTVIQSYLYRSRQDVIELMKRRIPIRLVKGAYLEPGSIAFQKKKDADSNFVELMQMLLTGETYNAIATHDEAIINTTKAFAGSHNISKDHFEFQMLFGIRRDLQVRLAQEGFKVRIYIPYGARWYPYFMRRLAERPANVLFILRNLFRE
jgi:proline dehydrogenase